MGSYQNGVFATLMEEVKKLAKQNGIGVIPFKDYPMLPIYPVASIHIDNHSLMFSETALTQHGKAIISEVLLFVQTYIERKEGQRNDYKIPCGVVSGYDKKCEAGSLCPACTEVVRLRSVVDELTSNKIFNALSKVSETATLIKGIKELLDGMSDKDAAKARLMAVARDLTTVEFPTQDPKYVIISGKICNAKTKEPIPDDEPIMIFRAKDKQALFTLEHYRKNHHYNDDHDKAIGLQILRFADFACQNPDRMKTPDT